MKPRWGLGVGDRWRRREPGNEGDLEVEWSVGRRIRDGVAGE